MTSDLTCRQAPLQSRQRRHCSTSNPCLGAPTIEHAFLDIDPPVIHRTKDLRFRRVRNEPVRKHHRLQQHRPILCRQIRLLRPHSVDLSETQVPDPSELDNLYSMRTHPLVIAPALLRDDRPGAQRSSNTDRVLHLPALLLEHILRDLDPLLQHCKTRFREPCPNPPTHRALRHTKLRRDQVSVHTTVLSARSESPPKQRRQMLTMQPINHQSPLHLTAPRRPANRLLTVRRRLPSPSLDIRLNVTPEEPRRPLVRGSDR